MTMTANKARLSPAKAGGQRAKMRLSAFAGLSGLMLAISPAFAQQTGNPIPSSGGALVMPKAALPDPLEAGWKGEKICEVMQENDKLRALKCTFAPAKGHERHYHPPHFGYILQGGKMRITDRSGVREQETPTGASWKSDGIEWHEAVNIGDTTAVYIIVEPKGAM